ncbi:MAG: glutamate-1-semialdehyde 2,1-aminomutase [Gammaproteobacteria bacterium]|jgi:glutamate-1-semialdehyde 2,1-aminomutase
MSRLNTPSTNGEAQQKALDTAAAILPGGVLGSTLLPEDLKFVFSHGKGGRFWDVSGKEYIDYCLGSGPLILGHAHPAVAKAAAEQAMRGTHFFAYLNDNSVRLAQRIVDLVPAAEKVRFVSSGSEATFNAMRLARGFTGREKILKFEGGYHGHHDYAHLSTYPQRTANYPTPLPDSAGIPKSVQDLTLIAPYNDLAATRSIVEAHADDLAAIIVEPIQRIISPADGFLKGLRDLADEFSIVLIFDEVVTGFRYGLGGAQTHFGVVPDLCTLGKIIGGGTPLGAIAGAGPIMDLCDPSRKGSDEYVYQNGTLNGNPLCTAIALATLDELARPGTYEALFENADYLRAGLTKVLQHHALPAICFGDGPMWHISFAAKPPTNHRDVMAADNAAGVRLDYELMRQGIFILPGTRRFVSTTHTREDFDQTFEALDRACTALRESPSQ